MRKLKTIVYSVLIVIIGIGIGYIAAFRTFQKSRFYETIMVTYDGEQYHSEAFAFATDELRKWVSEQADEELRRNVLSVAVYPGRVSAMVVGSELLRHDTKHLEILSFEANNIIRESPRRRDPSMKIEGEQDAPRNR